MTCRDRSYDASYMKEECKERIARPFEHHSGTEMHSRTSSRKARENMRMPIREKNEHQERSR